MSAPAAVLTEVWAWRQLLANLVRKELKVRYKGSALGILWSLISPLMMAVVFTVVFKTFLRIPFGNGDFTVFFLAGYLMWQFFQNSVMASSGSIIGNGQLISKVYFPRELLPLSLVISQGVHLLIAYVATAPLFIYYRGFHPELLPLLAVALVLLAVFTAGVSMYFGALTIKYRDLTEFLPILIQVWFYLTPIIYALETIRGSSARGEDIVRFIRINPMTWFAELFHTLLYGIALPVDPADPTGGVAHPPPGNADATTWAFCAVFAVVALLVGYTTFRRAATMFAKQV